MANCITLQKQVTFQLMSGNVGQCTAYFPYPTLPNFHSTFRMSGCFWSFKYFYEQQQLTGPSKIESDACHMFLNLVKSNESSDIGFQYLCDSGSQASVGGLYLSQTKWVQLKISFINPETKQIASEISAEGEPFCGKVLCPCKQMKLCLKMESFCNVQLLQDLYVINKCAKPINGMTSTYYCSLDAVVTLTLFPHSLNPNPSKTVTFAPPHHTPVVSTEVNSCSLQNDTPSRVFHAKIQTDFKLIAEGKEFPCHKCILAGHSKVFSKMFHDLKKPNNMTSTSNPSRLVLQNISVLGVESFLKYLYYSDTSFSNLPLYVSLDLLRIAEKYGISHLKQASYQVLFSKTPDDLDLDTGIQLYLFANSPAFPPFLSSAQYSSLKKTALKCFIKKYVDLVKSPEFVKLFQENMETAQELLIKIHKNKDKL